MPPSTSCEDGCKLMKTYPSVLGAPQQLTTSARIDLTRSRTDHAAWHADGRDLPHPCRRRVYRGIGSCTDVCPRGQTERHKPMLIGEAAQSEPIGGKVLASRAGQFFASAEAIRRLRRPNRLMRVGTPRSVRRLMKWQKGRLHLSARRQYGHVGINRLRFGETSCRR